MGKVVASREAISAIKKQGWRLDRQKGSHCQFKHSTKPGRVTIPHPRKELSPGVIRDIEDKTGIKL